MANNPSIKAQNQLLLAAQQRRHAARADYQPTLELEGAAAAWSRDSSTRDDLRVGLNFVLPLWQGGRQDAALAKEQARITEIQARQDALVLDVRESVLSLREEIDYLQNTARRVADLNAQYRNLALDKARAEYELELKTNLGSSMAETQLAKLKQRSVEYRLALALARLDALLGTAMQEQQKDKP
jgi:outer membrane protein TolC